MNLHHFLIIVYTWSTDFRIILMDEHQFATLRMQFIIVRIVRPLTWKPKWFLMDLCNVSNWSEFGRLLCICSHFFISVNPNDTTEYFEIWVLSSWFLSLQKRNDRQFFAFLKMHYFRSIRTFELIWIDLNWPDMPLLTWCA